MLLLQAGIMIVVFVTLTLHGSYDTQTDYGMYGTEDRFGCKVCNIGKKNGINVCTHCKIGWEKEPFACKKCQFGSEAGKYDCQLCRRNEGIAFEDTTKCRKDDSVAIERSQGGTMKFPSTFPLFYCLLNLPFVQSSAKSSRHLGHSGHSGHFVLLCLTQFSTDCVFPNLVLSRCSEQGISRISLQLVLYINFILFTILFFLDFFLIST